jgi:hypothetical protein
VADGLHLHLLKADVQLCEFAAGNPFDSGSGHRKARIIFRIRPSFYFIYTDLFLGLREPVADGLHLHSLVKKGGNLSRQPVRFRLGSFHCGLLFFSPLLAVDFHADLL